jgi:hypothetical protein
MLRSPFGVSRESQGLDSQDAWTMLQAMHKHCFELCSSTASGNAQAMLKHAEELPSVRVVRTTYGEHEQIMRDHRCRRWGLVTDRILDSKICRWPGLVGREDCPLPWHPTKRPRDAHSNLVSSSRLVPLRPQYYFQRSKGAIRMLLATADEIRLISQVSCLMFRVTVSSRFIVLVTDEIDRNGMMQRNYRRAVSKSWARWRGAGKFIEQILRILQAPPLELLGEPAVDGDVGCPGPCVVPIEIW